MSQEPKTVAEKLDAAQDGQQFGAVLNELFRALEKAKDEAEEDRRPGPFPSRRPVPPQT